MLSCRIVKRLIQHRHYTVIREYSFQEVYSDLSCAQDVHTNKESARWFGDIALGICGLHPLK